MWTTTNMFARLNQSEPIESREQDTNQPTPVLAIDTPDLESMPAASDSLSEELSALMQSTDPSVQPIEMQMRQMHNEEGEAPVVVLQTDAELTQNEINDILSNLALSPSAALATWEQPQMAMYSMNEECGQMDNQYGTTGQEDNLLEYLRMPSVEPNIGKRIQSVLQS